MSAESIDAKVSRRALITGGIALGAAPFIPQLTGTADAAFGFAPADMTSVVVRPMVFPVDGPVAWSDSYGACRDGCSRYHEGQDLMGTKLQKLLACVDGTVVGFKYSAAGNYLYLEDAGGWYYGYLHINNDTPGTDDGANPRAWAFAPGIQLGSQVRKGQHIAFLGDSGNAETTAPHLHYEIRKPSDVWYHAAAVNAKYSLNAASHVGALPVVSPATFTPWTTSSAFVRQQYVDLVGRPATSGELTTWTGRLDRGESSPADLVAMIVAAPGAADTLAPLIRLYAACFSRLPDNSGLFRWNLLVIAGMPLDAVADQFCASSEFLRVYGVPDDDQFVRLVYRNVLNRLPDEGGRSYWVGQLAGSMSRGRLLRLFADSGEYRARMDGWTRLTLVYIGMLRRVPDPSGFLYWFDLTSRGTPLQTAIGSIQLTGEYAARFPGAGGSRAVPAERRSPAAPVTTAPPPRPTTTVPKGTVPASSGPAPTAGTPVTPLPRPAPPTAPTTTTTTTGPRPPAG